MSGHEDPTPEPEDAVFDGDPWMRFDLWSGRVWSCVASGLNFALENPSEGGMMRTEVQASFCAAQFAQEMAQMVNPLASSPGGAPRSVSAPSGIPVQAILDLIIDEDDLD